MPAPAANEKTPDARRPSRRAALPGRPAEGIISPGGQRGTLGQRQENMLNSTDAVLVVIDIQGKLASLMHERDALYENAARLIKGAKVLGIPIIWTEQNPAGLGPTVPEIAALLEGEPIPKFAFSCCGEEKFMQALRAAGRRQVLLAGIEGHVCVYQTAVDLLAAGYEVHVVADAVSSRTFANRHLALAKMKDAGAEITSVEMALFEMLRVAEGEKFRQIIRIVK